MKKSLCLLMLAATLIFFTACHSTYSETNLSTQPPPILRNTSRIYVAIPFDATFKGKVAEHSGKQAADALGQQRLAGGAKTDFPRHRLRHRFIGRTAHQLQSFTCSLIRKDIEKWRLSQLNR